MPAPQTLCEYRLAIDDLDRAILTLAGRINAATYELLVLVREFDERAGWLKWGFDNCTQWLHWRCDLSLSAAREKIRVAHALKDLPQISAAFESGKLSYSKVRALKLEAESWHAQQADALVCIARNHLNGGADSGGHCADNYQVLIHVDESALTRGEGRSDLAIDSVKRLTCDGGIVGLVENAEGEPLRLGRKQRTVSAALRRALNARDRGCRFPGRTHTRYIQAHHVRHWADGGETNLDSLVSLCPRHHRLCHEGGYTIATDHEGRWYFRRPDGRAIPAFGYRPDDMVDDDMGTSAEGSRQGEVVSEGRAIHDHGTSAEGYPIRPGNCVREPAAPYCH